MGHDDGRAEEGLPRPGKNHRTQDDREREALFRPLLTRRIYRGERVRGHVLDGPEDEQADRGIHKARVSGRNRERIKKTSSPAQREEALNFSVILSSTQDLIIF